MGRYVGDHRSSPVAATVGRASAPAVAELALPALTVVAGLQLLRLMVTTVVSVYRDRRGRLTRLALFAFLVVGLGFLAAPPPGSAAGAPWW